MSACGPKTWELTLTVDSTSNAVTYFLGVVDVFGTNNIRGSVVEDGFGEVSRLTGTCTPGPGSGQSTMSCAFNVKGVGVGGVKIQMDGIVTGNTFDGTFTVSDAGVNVPIGSALADPGDTGTSGGTGVTDDDLPARRQDYQQEAPRTGEAATAEGDSEPPATSN